jgi:hypothetical protein
MSSGHRHHEGFGLNSQALDRYLKNEKVQQELYTPRQIDEEHDIPYLGGYSKDGKTIYFDRHLPDTVTLERDGAKRTFDPVQFLRLHESLEKTLLDQLGMSYQDAHKAATAYERRGVLQTLGPGWWELYQREMEKYIKADAHEKLKKVPRNLDLTPYIDEHDKELLTHLKECMSGKKSKGRKD